MIDLDQLLYELQTSLDSKTLNFTCLHFWLVWILQGYCSLDSTLLFGSPPHISMYKKELYLKVEKDMKYSIYVCVCIMYLVTI